MKQWVVTALSFVFLLSTSVVYAQETSVRQNDSVDHEKLIDLSVELMNAVESKDQAALERLVAENFFVTSPGDLVEVKRADWIANSISMDWEHPKFQNFRVDVYGDTAVVTSVLDFKVSGGKIPIPIITNAQLVDVWTRRSGQWQISARHLGAYSIGGYLRLAGGFTAGLTLCFLIWLVFWIRRRPALSRS